MRIILLGEFAGGAPQLPVRLTHLRVEKRLCPELDQLPAPLTGHDLLITELAWLNRLGPDARDALRAHARAAAYWIALTDAGEGFAEQVAWQRAGVSHLFRKPLHREQLAPLVQRLYDLLDGPPLRVLLLDGTHGARSRHAATLESAGMVVRVVREPAHLLDAIVEFAADLLLVDAEPHGCSAAELIVFVRQQPSLAELPIIVLGAAVTVTERLATLPIATDYLPDSLAPALL
ncbi:MAG: hypothetical protein EPO03_13095, partial [Porticoccaceae bacterium]